MPKNRDVKTRKPRRAYGPAQWAAFLLAVALIMALSIAASGSLRAAGDGIQWRLPENPLEGRDLFITKKCVNCHSVWGEGNDFGPDLSQIGRNRSLLQLSGLLWNHSESMDETMIEQGIERPAFEPEEMRQLLTYLFFLNYFDEPGDFYKGENLFRERKCGVCHSVGGKGGGLAVPLDDFKQDMSPILLAQAMWNAGREMTAAMSGFGIESPKFQGEEYSHLLAYIRGAAIGESGEPGYLYPGSPLKGKETFEEKGCSSCHALGGGGGKKVGPNLDNKDLWKSVSEYSAIMWNHSSKMWAEMSRLNNREPIFEGNELADVIAYLYYNFYVDEPGDPAKGKKYFESKNCSKCHQVAGVGTIAGPDLTRSEGVASPVALATSMWNHAPIMAEALRGEDFSWPKFSGDEMRDLLSFIKASAGAGASKTKKTKKAKSSSH